MAANVPSTWLHTYLFVREGTFMVDDVHGKYPFIEIWFC